MNQITEAVTQRCCIKKVLQPEGCNFIKKETLAQVLSCEFYEISKNNFFHRTPPVTTSEVTKTRSIFMELLCILFVLYVLTVYPISFIDYICHLNLSALPQTRSIFCEQNYLSFKFVIIQDLQINQFTISFPLKTPGKKQRFPGFFRGYKMEKSAKNGLKPDP